MTSVFFMMNKELPNIVFATNNLHKLEEARALSSGIINILSLSDIDCHDDIPETADTLEGNALIKARWVKEKYGYDCFADDTGLMVDALDGKPGVYSARFAGRSATRPTIWLYSFRNLKEWQRQTALLVLKLS